MASPTAPTSLALVSAQHRLHLVLVDLVVDVEVHLRHTAFLAAQNSPSATRETAAREMPSLATVIYAR